MGKQRVKGLDKAAIVLNALGQDQAIGVLKQIRDIDVRKLISPMQSFNRVPVGVVNEVLREFLNRLSEKDELIFDTDFTKPDVLGKALGEERAKIIFGKIKHINLVQRPNLTVLESVDVKTVAEFLMEEHPQTIALVTAHLDLDKQVSLIKQLPDSIRAEVLIRMASLENIAPEKVTELDEILKDELEESGKLRSAGFGGVMAIAELINSLDRKTMNSVMTRLEDKEPLLAEEIRQNMFTFADLIKIDDRGIQTLLREVPQDKLLRALKTASDGLRDKIFNAMSERARELLKDDLAAMGPTKVSEIEAAQREIVAIVKRLEDEGKIVIGVGEESELV